MMLSSSVGGTIRILLELFHQKYLWFHTIHKKVFAHLCQNACLTCEGIETSWDDNGIRSMVYEKEMFSMHNMPSVEKTGTDIISDIYQFK